VNFEIYLDNYIFSVKITHFSPGYPAKLYGPWEDCHEGVDNEVEWECTAVEEALEDGTVVEVTVDIDEYSELIEEKILAEIEEMADDACQDSDFDYPEPNDY
jgi:hypothetical protein